MSAFGSKLAATGRSFRRLQTKRCSSDMRCHQFVCKDYASCNGTTSGDTLADVCLRSLPACIDRSDSKDDQLIRPFVSLHNFAECMHSARSMQHRHLPSGAERDKVGVSNRLKSPFTFSPGRTR